MFADRIDSRPLPGARGFRFGHRAFRALFLTAWTLLAAWTPPPLHGWRRFILRCFGADIAPTARIHASARIWFPPNLSMAGHSLIGPRVNCYCMDRISIGAHAVISQGAHLCGGTHRLDSPDFALVTRPITIGDHAWIAAEAFLGPGCVVGQGAVLGARGVAFGALEAWMVYAGNPAKPLRRRPPLPGVTP